MAKFEIQQADRPVNVQSTAAPITYDATAPYRALANAGNAIAEIGQQRLKKQARLAEKEREKKVYAEIENGKIALSEFDAETDNVLRGITDPDEIQKIAEKRLQDRSELYQSFATLPESQQMLDLYTRKSAVNQVEDISKLRYDRQKDNSYVAFDVRYQELAKEGKFGLLAAKADQAFKADIINEKEYARRLQEIPDLQHDWHVNEVRELSQSLVPESGDKTKAYEAINKAQKGGLITAEDNKILGDSLDNFVSGRFRKDKEAQYTKTLESYSDFTGKIIQGDLTYEDIGTSPLLKADKEKWATYIKGQNKPAPSVSTPIGFNTSIESVVLSNTLELSKQEAIDDLMEERYVNQSINDDQLAWALDKIENPYPKHFLPDLRATLKDNKDNYNEFFRRGSKDERQAQNVNSMLISWVDNEIKEGRYPKPEDLFVRSQQLRTIASEDYSIGQEIERRGKTYEVVGFDVDGEPLVDEVR
jgi:hypothetical protein